MPDTDDSRSTKSGKSSSCLAPSTAPTSPETHRAGIEQQPPDNFLDMSSDGGSSTRGSAATSPHGSAAGSPARGAAIGSSARGSVGGSPLRGAAVTSPSRGAPVGSPLRGPPIVSPTGSSSFLDTYSTPDAWERRPQPGGSTDSPGAMPNTASPHGGGSQQGSQGGQATGLWLDTYDRRQQNRGPPQGATFGSPASNPSSRHSGFSEGRYPSGSTASIISYASGSGGQSGGSRQRSGNMSPISLDARGLPSPAAGQSSPAPGTPAAAQGDSRAGGFQSFGGAFQSDPNRHTRTESGPTPRTGTERPPTQPRRPYSDQFQKPKK